MLNSFSANVSFPANFLACRDRLGKRRLSQAAACWIPQLKRGHDELILAARDIRVSPMNDPDVSTPASSEFLRIRSETGLPARRKRAPVRHWTRRQIARKVQIGRDFCSRCAPSPEKTGVADK